jgi:hypothetical protein
VPIVDRLAAAVTTVPELVEPLVAFLEAVARCRGAATDGSSSFGDAEVAIEEAGDRLVRDGLCEVLRAHEPDTKFVEIDSVLYRRMNPTFEGTYFSRRGPITIVRALYRQTGRHNGPIVVPLELAAGIVEGRWTPKAAVATAMLVQETTSRDAEAICNQLGVLPYSRSSLARATTDMGTRWDDLRETAEQKMIESFEVPRIARMVSVSVDRVSIPMDERREGRGVAFRMAYAAVWTLHDLDGTPLDSVRYGAMPARGNAAIEQALHRDLVALLDKRPNLSVVALSDGAPEMQHILERVTADLGVDVTHALDFWHAVEKIAEAARSVGLDPKVELRAIRELLATDPLGVEGAERTLRGWMTLKEATPEPLQAAVRYLANNRERMRYASLRARRLPIGSGHVEATCKTLVSTRMKRAGSRWTTSGGQAVLGLRSLAKSSRWSAGMDHVTASYAKKVTPRAA